MPARPQLCPCTVQKTTKKQHLGRGQVTQSAQSERSTSSGACCACVVCSLDIRDNSVDDRPCVTAVPFSFGGFSLTQTNLSTNFSVFDYVLPQIVIHDSYILLEKIEVIKMPLCQVSFVSLQKLLYKGCKWIKPIAHTYLARDLKNNPFLFCEH